MGEEYGSRRERLFYEAKFSERAVPPLLRSGIEAVAGQAPLALAGGTVGSDP